MDEIQLSPDAMRILRFMSCGDATRSEIAAFRLPYQSRVLTELQANRLIRLEELPRVCNHWGRRDVPPTVWRGAMTRLPADR